MSSINTKSVLRNGLIAGVVMNAIDIIANMTVADQRIVAHLDAINPILWRNMNAQGRLTQYILIDFVFAIGLIWLYAAIRPRFGPGPATAVRAALYAWLMYNVTQLLFVMMGLFTFRYVAVNALVLLVNYLATALVGARLYKEGAAAPSTFAASD